MAFSGFQIGGSTTPPPVSLGGYDPGQAAAMQQALFGQYRPQSAASVIQQANAAEAQLPAYLQINPNLGQLEYNQAKQQYMTDLVGPAVAQQSARDNANGIGNSSFAAQRGAFLQAEGLRNADAVGLQAKQAAQGLQLAQRNSYFGGTPSLVPNVSAGQYLSGYGNFLSNQQMLGAKQNQAQSDYNFQNSGRGFGLASSIANGAANVLGAAGY